MKKIALLFALSIIISFIHANDKYNTSQIEKVTIFRRGAQVFRTATINISQGESTIYFDGLTNELDQQTLQLGGVTNFTISSISYIQNYQYEEIKSEEFMKLKTRLEEIHYENISYQDEIDVLNEEERLILSNKKINNDGKTKVADLIELAQFYRKRLLEIKRLTQKLSHKIKILSKERSGIIRQLEEIKIKNKKPSTGVVVLQINAEKSSIANIKLSYLVKSASWKTTYDLNVKDINSPIDLLSKAMITQSTGEDWNNIDVKISTGNPRRSSTLPFMSTWFLDYNYSNSITTSGKTIRNLPTRSINNLAGSAAGISSMDNGDISIRGSRTNQTNYYIDGVRVINSRASLDYGISIENITSMEFDIDQKVTIPSDGKAHEIQLEHQDLIANFEYFAIPKKDRAAFLVAQIPNWHDYNLMNGIANLYFEGTYVGKSTINPAQTSDTLDISLGVDIAVTIDYKRIKKEMKKKFLSNKVTQKRGWEITIQNGKSQDITITINDQIPISSRKEIEVICLEKSNGQLNNESGIIEWKSNIESGDQQKYSLIYEVKYPKKKQVALN